MAKFQKALIFSFSKDNDIWLNLRGSFHLQKNMSNHCPEPYPPKVEKILKGSLDSISSPSPSVKIQIMGGKVCLRRKGKTLLGIDNKLFVFKSLLTKTINVLHLHLSRPWFEFSLKIKVMGSNQACFLFLLLFYSL